MIFIPFILFNLFNIADGLGTYNAIYNLGLEELNPLVAFLMGEFSVYGLIGVKVMALVASIVLLLGRRIDLLYVATALYFPLTLIHLRHFL